jgi:hypothetical protein
MFSRTAQYHFFCMNCMWNADLLECFGENDEFPSIRVWSTSHSYLKSQLCWVTSRRETCKNILCAYWINYRQDRVESKTLTRKNIADHSLMTLEGVFGDRRICHHFWPADLCCLTLCDIYGILWRTESTECDPHMQ